MRRSTMITISAIILILVITGMALLTGKTISKKDMTGRGWSQTVTVKDGKLSVTESPTEPIDIPEKGSYFINIKMLPKGKEIEEVTQEDYGFITALLITGPDGSCDYGTSAGAMTCDTTVILDKGTHNLKLFYFANEDEYIEFAKTNLCSANDAKIWAADKDFPSVVKDGTWEMQYYFEFTPKAEDTGLRVMVAILSILLALSLAVIILATKTKDRYVNGARYDERQEIERGRAGLFSFFVTLAGMLGAMIFDLCGVLRNNAAYVYAGVLFIGIAVFAVYCIRHDCYFAINDNRKLVIGILIAVFVINAIVCVSQIISGRFLVSGRSSYGTLNLLGAALSIVLFITMITHKVAESKEDDDEEE